MKGSLIVPLFLLLFVNAHAQFNDSINYHINLAATGIINRTETARSYVFNNQLKANARKNDFALNSTHSWIYGQLNDVLSNNDYASTLDFTYRKDSSRVEYWALGNFEKSYSLRVNSRMQYGGGVSYDFIKNGDDLFNISNGLLYESSNLKINDSVNDVYQTWRNSFRVKFRFAIKELLVLESVNFLQNSLSNKADYIMRSNTTLGIKIYKWVSLTTAFNYNKLNRLKRENVLFTLGVAFEKYF